MKASEVLVVSSLFLAGCAPSLQELKEKGKPELCTGAAQEIDMETWYGIETASTNCDSAEELQKVCDSISERVENAVQHEPTVMVTYTIKFRGENVLITVPLHSVVPPKEQNLKDDPNAPRFWSCYPPQNHYRLFRTN
jgi:hypothetical protein